MQKNQKLNISYTEAQKRLQEIEIILSEYQNKNNQQNSNSSITESKDTLMSLSLDQLCELYEEGQLLLKHCANLLNTAKQRIEIASENGFIPYA